jgi:hypothetical protein
VGVEAGAIDVENEITPAGLTVIPAMETVGRAGAAALKAAFRRLSLASTSAANMWAVQDPRSP